MVKLEEVEDEEFIKTTDKDLAEDDDDYTDTDSEISAEDEDDVGGESFRDRIAALQDIVSPSTRQKISSTVSTVSSYVKSGLWFGGKGAWVISTSALLFGIPFALAIVEEQQIMEMEREEKARQMGTELMTPGATSQPAQGQARPAL